MVWDGVVFPNAFQAPHFFGHRPQKVEKAKMEWKEVNDAHCLEDAFPSSVPSPEMFPPVVSHSDKINGEMEENMQTEAQFVRQFVERHNELRELHGSPKLTVSEELCAMAKEWASKIAWQGHVSFAEMSGVGENVTVFPEGKCAREMVDYWYEENRKYEYDSPGWQEGTNYFSQIIWRSTKEIGVSRSTMRSFPQPTEREKKIANGNLNAVKNVVVVAFYRPAGNSNRSGQFVLNVSKPIAH
uniref:SCP domain-containing protein n=1 Tax=Globodera rostochiensis TaxID=31243 RepID=A0A914H402_GLORO